MPLSTRTSIPKNRLTLFKVDRHSFGVEENGEHDSSSILHIRYDGSEESKAQMEASIDNIHLSSDSSSKRQGTLLVEGVAIQVDDVRLIRSILQRLQHSVTWKSIRLQECTGPAVYDLLAVIFQMAPDLHAVHYVPSDGPPSFVWWTSSNNPSLFLLCHGLCYSEMLKEFCVSIPFASREQIDQFARALVQAPCLERLSVAGSIFSRLQDPDVTLLGFGLRFAPHLKALCLDQCQLTDSTLHSLLSSLVGNKVTHLSIQGNTCGSQSMSALADLLHSNQLIELDMSYLLRPEKSKSSPASPEEKVQYPTKVEEGKEEEDLKTKNTILGDTNTQEGVKDDLKPEAEADDQDVNKSPPSQPVSQQDTESWIANSSLKVLQLAGNHLGDAYVENLFGTAFHPQSCSLEQINLFGNRLTESGLGFVLQKVKEWKKVQRLYLGHNLFCNKLSLQDVPDHPLVVFCKHSYRPMDIRLHSLLADGSDADLAVRELAQLVNHYRGLNEGGRRIFDSSSSQIPTGLWPHVLAFANRQQQRGEERLPTVESAPAADCIYSILKLGVPYA